MGRLRREHGSNRFPIQYLMEDTILLAGGDDHGHSRIHGNLCRINLRHHAAGSHRGPSPTGKGLDLRRDFPYFLDQPRLGILLGISRIQPVDIRKNDQCIRIHKSRHHGRKAVVVANLDLIHRHRVILIDDGNGSHLKKRQQSITGMNILMVPCGIFLREQELTHDLAVFRKEFLIHVHEHSLPNSGHCLFPRNGVRLLVEPKLSQSGCNGTGGNQQDFLALVREIHQFPDELLNAQEIEPSRPIGQRARPHLDDNAPGLSQPCSCIHPQSPPHGSSIFGFSSFFR